LDAGTVKVRTLTLPDTYQDHDTPERMYKDAKLDAQSIVDTVKQVLPANESGKAGRLRLA
ncbi:hypothetical protein, partial [Methylobacterium sp.]|uniref:hypothetical protein n=1 Tax=Methylobacterium sp. TaxID=409 RepID=UPI00257E86ED